MASEIHVGDIGTIFESTVLNQDGNAVNLSGATAQFMFEKPDSSMLVVNCSFVTDGSDGKIKYVTVDGDLDQNGTWQYQVYYEVESEVKYSTINKFKVKPNLPL